MRSLRRKLKERLSPSRASRKSAYRCFFYSHDPHIICAVHPAGPASNSCIDFRVDLESGDGRYVDFLQLLEDETTLDDGEQWEPEGARYIGEELVIERVTYNGEEIIQPEQRWTTEQQLELLEWHPIFTGKCPSCGAAFNRDYTARVHWDCECGWMDDTV